MAADENVEQRAAAYLENVKLPDLTCSIGDWLKWSLTLNGYNLILKAQRCNKLRPKAADAWTYSKLLQSGDPTGDFPVHGAEVPYQYPQVPAVCPSAGYH